MGFVNCNDDIIAYCIGDEIVCAECFDENLSHLIRTRDNIILTEDLETYESQGTWLFCDRSENCDGQKLKPPSQVEGHGTINDNF